MRRLIALALLCLWSLQAVAAGTLQPLGANTQPIKIVDHDVAVTINNGFARVAVSQRFNNPNEQVLEALYAFPIPKSASLSEMHIQSGETRLAGEVVAKDRAKQVYEEEKSKGNDAGLASQEGYQRFEFRVTPLPPKQDVLVEFVYYQPVDIDSSMGRFVYPLAEGGTDEEAKAFWSRNEKVENAVSINVTLKTAWPVEAVRAPGLEQTAQISKVDEQTWTLKSTQSGASLNRDFVFYYRLAENLPGRVEVIPFRADKNKPGTFMMLLTPGLDLKPVAQTGADYIFVLDVSGSMSGKIAVLANGVSQALGKLSPKDRFRIVSFNDRAREVQDWTTATPENVQAAVQALGQLGSSGGTNLYDGLFKAFEKLDADRVSSVILVTDGVTNQGLVDPKDFVKLLKNYDIRVFGFLMGNSSNWPLLNLIAEQTGGFYTAVSNDDDIVGKLLQAKSKITTEALHDVDVKISGAGTADISGQVGRKIYRGQQIMLFGRYSAPGKAKIQLKAKLSGADQVYSTEVVLPELAREHPELERLWAMSRIEDLERGMMLGLADEGEAKSAIRDLGVGYQLVTDETSMLVLRDEAFQQHGIERRNQARMQQEHAAQSLRAAAPAQSYRADAQRPMFSGKAPSLGGGGAAGPLQLLLWGLLGSLAWCWRRRQ